MCEISDIAAVRYKLGSRVIYLKSIKGFWKYWKNIVFEKYDFLLKSTILLGLWSNHVLVIIVIWEKVPEENVSNKKERYMYAL